MKKTIPACWIFLVVFLTVSFSSLTAMAETFNTRDYWPLESGMSWTYLEDSLTSVTDTVLSGDYYINGIATKAVQQSGGEFSGTILNYSNNENGLKRHQEFTPGLFIEGVGFVDLTVVYSPPIKHANANATLGEIINSSGKADFIYSGLGTVELDYNSTTKIVQFENITIPIDSLIAVKIHFSLTISGYIDNQFITETITSTFWLAKYVGPVKGVTIADGVESISELVSINFQPFLSADFTANQTTGFTGQSINFTDNSDGNISSWLWDFGDGNTSTLQNPTHSYITPGNYSISLTVSGLGNSATETKTNYINISIQDTDNDGLSDYEEENTYLTNPNNSDTDGDGLNDGDEVKIYGTSPVNIDSDSDEIPDGWEVNNGLDPLDYSDAGDDNDGDGVNNILEYKYNTDPMDPNSKPTLGLPWLMLLLE